MSKKTILVLLSFAFLFSFKLVRAEVIINEVMYNPTDGSNYEWIEIYNNGNEQVDLDGWRFFNSESSSAPLRTAGSFILEPNSYALITSNGSLVSFSGQIFTSSQFSLPNDSAKYGTYKGVYSDANKTTGSAITYDTGLGANGDGNSLQLVNGSWVSGTPTLGAENQTSQTNNDSNNDNNSNSDTNTDTNTPSVTTETKTKIIKNPTMKAKILANTLAFTGEPLEMKTEISGFFNENVILGRAYWNFGDGGSLEQVNNFEKFYHTYYYPGEYAVFLDYYLNNFSKEPDITNKIVIKVLPTTVSISKVGDEKDFFVELTNNASSDIDISNWVLNANGKIFILPKNSVIMSKKLMTISSKITGFSVLDKGVLKLLNAQRETIFDYASPLVPVETLTENYTQAKISVAESAPVSNVLSETTATPQTSLQSDTEGNINTNSEMPTDNLGAEAIKSDVNTKSNFMFGIGLFAFLGISAGAVYFIRNRNRKAISETTPGGDFEIIDE